MTKILLACVMFLTLTGLNAQAAGYTYEVPGAAQSNRSRLTIRSTDTVLVAELLMDGKPFTHFRLEEISGNPLVFWVTSDKFVFLGCGQSESCDDRWRVGSLKQRSQSFVKLKGLMGTYSLPQRQGHRMAYSERLPNGNIGCSVYDWSTERHVVQWDSGSKEGVDIQISKDGTVTCRQIVSWIPLDNQGGDGPTRQPIFGKSYSQKLSDPVNLE